MAKPRWLVLAVCLPGIAAMDLQAMVVDADGSLSMVSENDRDGSVSMLSDDEKNASDHGAAVARWEEQPDTFHYVFTKGKGHFCNDEWTVEPFIRTKDPKTLFATFVPPKSDDRRPPAELKETGPEGWQDATGSVVDRVKFSYIVPNQCSAFGGKGFNDVPEDKITLYLKKLFGTESQLPTQWTPLVKRMLDVAEKDYKFNPQESSGTSPIDLVGLVSKADKGLFKDVKTQAEKVVIIRNGNRNPGEQLLLVADDNSKWGVTFQRMDYHYAGRFIYLAVVTIGKFGDAAALEPPSGWRSKNVKGTCRNTDKDGCGMYDDYGSVFIKPKSQDNPECGDWSGVGFYPNANCQLGTEVSQSDWWASFF